MTMIAEAFRQRGFQTGAHDANVVQQIFVPDHPLHFQRGGAGDRMRLIGLAMQEPAGAVGQRLNDTVGD